MAPVVASGLRAYRGGGLGGGNCGGKSCGGGGHAERTAAELIETKVAVMVVTAARKGCNGGGSGGKKRL